MSERDMQSTLPLSTPDAVTPPIESGASLGQEKIGHLVTWAVLGEGRSVAAVLDGPPVNEVLPTAPSPVNDHEVRTSEQGNTVNAEAVADPERSFQQPALGEGQQSSDSLQAPELTGQEFEKLTKMSISSNEADLLLYSAVVQSLNSDQLEQLGRYRERYLAQHANTLAVPAATTLATQSGYAPPKQSSSPSAPAAPHIPQPRTPIHAPQGAGAPHAPPTSPPWGNTAKPPVKPSLKARMRHRWHRLTGRR